MSVQLEAKAANIRLLILDVDGVLTDGRLYLGADGREQLKVFHVRDGYGIKAVMNAGIQVAVISGRSSPIVYERMQSLGVQHIYMDTENKRPRLLQLAEDLNIPLDQIAYVGDDGIDVEPMQSVGLPIAVGDAHPVAKAAALWTTHNSGGLGAVREVCDFLVESQAEI